MSGLDILNARFQDCVFLGFFQDDQVGIITDQLYVDLSALCFYVQVGSTENSRQLLTVYMCN